MRRIFLFIRHCPVLLILAVMPAYCQVENHLTLTGTGAYSASFSPAYEAGLMLGLRSAELADFRLGVFWRQLLVPVTHSGSYFSLMAMGSRRLFGRFGLHVQGELRQGSYLMADRGESSVKRTVNLFGNMGVNFQLNDRIQLLTSYVFQDYDPKGYLVKQQNPHDAGALKLGANYTIPLGPSFQSSGNHPR
jgi:hypothetical protein